MAAAVGGALIAGGVVIGAAAIGSGLTALGVGSGAACADGDCSNEVTSLYRAVSKAELDDIISTNSFRPNPGKSMDTKWFFENLDSAKGFNNVFPDLTEIIEAKVPSSILNTGFRVPNLDGFGPAVAFIDDTLEMLNRVLISVKTLLIK